MDLYKLHNIARRTIKVKPGEKLHTKKYSVQYLNSLAELSNMKCENFLSSDTAAAAKTTIVGLMSKVLITDGYG